MRLCGEGAGVTLRVGEGQAHAVEQGAAATWKKERGEERMGGAEYRRRNQGEGDAEDRCKIEKAAVLGAM